MEKNPQISFNDVNQCFHRQKNDHFMLIEKARIQIMLFIYLKTTNFSEKNRKITQQMLTAVIYEWLYIR